MKRRGISDKLREYMISQSWSGSVQVELNVAVAIPIRP